MDNNRLLLSTEKEFPQLPASHTLYSVYHITGSKYLGCQLFIQSLYSCGCVHNIPQWGILKMIHCSNISHQQFP